MLTSKVGCSVLTCQQEHRRNLEFAKRASPWSVVSFASLAHILASAGTHDDVVATGFSDHVRDKLGGDGRSRLVLLVLSGVEEVGDDGRDTSCRGNLPLA